MLDKTNFALLELTEFAKKQNRNILKIQFNSEDFVIWQTSDKKYFMTSAICPHRGADLAKGEICEDQLRCPYHGWKISSQGILKSHFENKSKGSTHVYPLTVMWGYLWLNFNSENLAKILPPPEFTFLGTYTFYFRNRLEITIDNFIDGAHLPFVHAINGPSPELSADTRFFWSESKTQAEDAGGDDNVEITVDFNYPQRPGTILSLFHFFQKTRWSVKAILGFDPLHVRYHIFWDKDDGKKLNGENRNMYFFYPVTDQLTAACCLMFHEVPKWQKWFTPIVSKIIRKMTQDLIEEDLTLVKDIYPLDQQKKPRYEIYDAPILKARERLKSYTKSLQNN